MVEITAFRLGSKLPPMKALEFIRDHVTFKLPYDFSYRMKTPQQVLNCDKNNIKCILESRDHGTTSLIA